MNSAFERGFFLIIKRHYIMYIYRGEDSRFFSEKPVKRSVFIAFSVNHNSVKQS